jgi:hypothetical protein
MKLVNRMAIVVRPKEPYCAWARSLDAEAPTGCMAVGAFCNVYLVDEGDIQHPEKVLRRHYADIFVEMLASWYRDESTWPARRTLTLFQEWFEAEVVEMVFDLSQRPLELD